VPTVEKSMMRSVQGKDPYPYGDALCVPLDEVTVFRQTSGTTGQPVYQPDTWQDWEWWAECWSYISGRKATGPATGCSFPSATMCSSLSGPATTPPRKIGCEVVPGGVLDTKARVLKVQELRATAMMGTPDPIYSGWRRRRA